MVRKYHVNTYAAVIRYNSFVGYQPTYTVYSPTLITVNYIGKFLFSC